MKDIYFVQVTDKFNTYGACIELHENRSLESATRIFEQCKKAYPEKAYRIQTNLPK